MRFYIFASIDCASVEQAKQVLSERLAHDEDYGFDYLIGATWLFRGEGVNSSRLGGNTILKIRDGKRIL